MAGKNKRNKPFPFGVYYWTIAVTAVIGFLDSIYLSISHYRVHMDVTYMSFCAISRALNCDTVSQSQYAIFFNVPVAVWGAVGYAFFLILLIFANSQKPSGQRVWFSLSILSFCYSFISIVLALITSFYIKSYCLMCILSFGVNFLLFYFVWIVRKRFADIGLKNSFKIEVQFWRNKSAIGSIFLFVLIITSFLLIIYYPKYWDYSIDLTADVKTGFTKEGHPWIGAEDPEYIITEFTDYQCFQCKKMQSYLRLLVAKNPEHIRLIHRHFPMDHTINPIVKKPYHVGSGKMALVAIYSASKGKFWEMNDLLFKIARNKDTLSIKEILSKVGLDLPDPIDPDLEKSLLKMLTDDINEGISLGLVGTPGYLIDGNVYSGQIPPEVIRKISREE